MQTQPQRAEILEVTRSCCTRGRPAWLSEALPAGPAGSRPGRLAGLRYGRAVLRQTHLTWRRGGELGCLRLCTVPHRLGALAHPYLGPARHPGRLGARLWPGLGLRRLVNWAARAAVRLQGSKAAWSGRPAPGATTWKRQVGRHALSPKQGA